MSENHERTRRSEGSTGENGVDDVGGDRGFSRRRFLRSGALAGAGALALGSSGPTAAQTEVRRQCGDGASIRVGNGHGTVVTNMWSTKKPEQCVFENDDGSYGWEWERRDTSACPENCPNYPQVVIGNKPWATSSSAPIFPTQLGNIDELDVDLDIDNGAEFIGDQGDEWNLALEWWHTYGQPPIGGNDPKHEVMLLLEWSESHDSTESIEDEAFEDAYGNKIDHWQMIKERMDWESFHIFRVSANEVPENLDLTAILDYLREFEDDPSTYDDDLWFTGIEVGNETWDYTRGKTTVHNLDVRLNGQVATTGTDQTFDEAPVDTEAPTPPEVFGADASSDDEAEVVWEEADDGGGTGVAEYRVTLTGRESRSKTVEAGTTSVTFTDLQASTEYEVSLVVVDGAGNESDPVTTTFLTPTAGYPTPTEGPPPIDGSQPTDPDDDGYYEDLTGNGETDPADVVTLFEEKNADAVANHPEYYDFSGNGEIEVADVVHLFGEL